MAELWVGPGESFSTLSGAVGASQDGDTIFIRAGVYANDFATINHPLSIIGVGGMAHLTASTEISNGKAILVTNADTVIENLEFSGAAVADRNGAGIRQQSGDLTVRDSYFHNNENGILSASNSTSQIAIENSTFDRNGNGTNSTHHLYIGRVESLTVTDSTFTEARDVTHIQSRAFSTTVANSTFDDTGGTASYLINLPNAGEGVITGNTLVYSETAGNRVAINYGTASLKHPGSITVEDNILINNFDPGKVVNGVRNATDHEAFVTDNILVRFDNAVIGNATQFGNQMLEAEITGDSGANILTGTAADELIDGRAGDDTISGGGGNDILVGGAGNDTFVIGADNGHDTVYGFIAGAGTEDRFDLSARSDVASFSSLLDVTSDDGTDTTIAFANGDRLSLANILVAELHPEDFIFDGTAPPPPVSEPAPPPVSGGELLSETFDDGNLAGWTVMDQGDVRGPSSWSVIDQEAVQKSNIHNIQLPRGTGREGTMLVWNDASAQSWQDYTVETTMRSTDNDGIGLAFYFQDTDNYYKVDFDHERSFSTLFQVKDGVETTLATTAGPGFVVGEETQLSVSVSGDGITVSRNGEDVFGGPVTGGSLAGGTVALYSWGNRGAHYDDVVVTSLNDLPPVSEAPPPVSEPAPPPVSEPTPPPGSGGELLSETFDDGNLAGWTVMDQGDVRGPSSWSVIDQEAVQKSNIHNIQLPRGTGREGTMLVWNDASAQSWQDYTVETTMRSTDNDGIGLAFYFQDTDNYYKVDFDHERSFSTLFQVKDGVETTLATTAGPGFVVGEETQLSVSVSGDGITVSRNGEDVFGGPVTGGSLAGGTVALYSWGNRGAHYDDVVVTSNQVATSADLHVAGQFGVTSEGTVDMAASDLSSASTGSTVNTASAEASPVASTTADTEAHEVPGGDGYSAYDTGSPRDAAFANAVAESA
ncbi:MAG: right-handed parallel beta-helix repeat-containing protein [Alphaproteobacteria bacterium]